MNSALVAAAGLAWLLVAYRFYGRFIERKLVAPDDSRQTPAHRLRDGVDFYPARPLVLFGHHFASIAGAGPILGPVIAVSAFGYGVSLLWVLVGVIFIGAVHDYTTAMLSVRNDGKSIPEITGGVVGRWARVFFQIFVWIALVFVVAVFAIAAAKTLIDDPRVVIPAFGLIPLAMVFGWLHNRLGVPLWISTVVALMLLAGLFILGTAFPLALHLPEAAQYAAFQRDGINPWMLIITDVETAKQIWIGILMLYGLIAAVLPVWLLLQPRDYIGYWILAFGMLAGFVGLFVTHRPVVAPFFTSVATSKGPVWPMLFILIACGAVSGFHSLVSSGTTSKQLDRESHARPVVFGAMVTEGGLALLALLAVSAGLAWKSASGDVPTLQSIMGAADGGPIAAFATGFGTFTEPFLGEFGVLFGVTMINAFVLTTLDTSVRLGRFITVELAGPIVKPLANRYLATVLVVGCAYGLAATGSVWSLWKMFGASNQLVAALAMLVVSVYLARRRRPSIYTLLPAIFMFVTTCGALVWQGHSYLTAEEPNITLAVAAGVLLVLALVVGGSGVRALWRQRGAG